MRSAADIQIYRTAICHQFRFIAHHGSGLDGFVFFLRNLDMKTFALQKADRRRFIQFCNSKLAKIQLVGSIADHNIDLTAL